MKANSSVLYAALLGALALGHAKAQTISPNPTAPVPPHGIEAGGPHHPGNGMHGGPEGMDMRMLPPGTWWRNQDVVSRIGLTGDQQKRIDRIFIDSRVKLIQMHAALEVDQLQLDSALQTTPFNQEEALSQVNKIADTRADLEKANARMLLSIRGVLNADQWSKLQAVGPGPGTPPSAMGGMHGDHRGGSHIGHPGGSNGPGGPDGFLPND